MRLETIVCVHAGKNELAGRAKEKEVSKAALERDRDPDSGGRLQMSTDRWGYCSLSLSASEDSLGWHAAPAFADWCTATQFRDPRRLQAVKHTSPNLFQHHTAAIRYFHLTKDVALERLRQRCYFCSTACEPRRAESVRLYPLPTRTDLV